MSKQNGLSVVERPKTEADGNGQLIPVQLADVAPTTEAKFTANLTSEGKISLTLRTNDEEEVDRFFDKWEGKIIVIKEPVESERTRFYPGDNCPQCSNKLVRRQGRNGKFLGCNSFPDCQFTQAL